MEERREPIKILQDGDLAYYDYNLWRGQNVWLKIRCQCGGETDCITIRCSQPTDCRCVPLVVGRCQKCPRELAVGVYFYRYELIDSDKPNRYHYLWRRNQLMPVEIKCHNCKTGVSFPVFFQCVGIGTYTLKSLCRKCQTLLIAEIEFIHS